jgi:hypothetical protein
MCDANDYAIGAVLGQSNDKKHYAISYTKDFDWTLAELRQNGKGISCRGICHRKV